MYGSVLSHLKLIKDPISLGCGKIGFLPVIDQSQTDPPIL